jgi:uncharacterized protein YozE (UPF0346 family)
MSFLQFMRAQPRTYDPEGCFISDAISDPDFPRRTTSWGQIRAYLYSCRACREAYPAAKTVWNAYQQTRKI